MSQLLISLYLVMESPDKTSTLHVPCTLIFIISEYATAFLTVVAVSLVFKPFKAIKANNSQSQVMT